MDLPFLDYVNEICNEIRDAITTNVQKNVDRFYSPKSTPTCSIVNTCKLIVLVSMWLLMGNFDSGLVRNYSFSCAYNFVFEWLL